MCIRDSRLHRARLHHAEHVDAERRLHHPLPERGQRRRGRRCAAGSRARPRQRRGSARHGLDLAERQLQEARAERAADELRPTTIEPGFVATATGSVLISCGGTRVICTASVQESVPRWMHGQGRGWLTAEYGICLLYTSPSPRDLSTSRMPSSA